MHDEAVLGDRMEYQASLVPPIDQPEGAVSRMSAKKAVARIRGRIRDPLGTPDSEVTS